MEEIVDLAIEFSEAHPDSLLPQKEESQVEEVE